MITKATPLSQLAGMLRTRPILAHPGDSIYSLALILPQQGRESHGSGVPCARVVCVVDSEDKLLGLVPLTVIIENVFYDAGEDVRGASAREQPFAEAPGVPGETARELMEAPLWVRPEDTVKDVVDRMLEVHLDGLPIVDGSMRVVGYVDVVELLSLWLGNATARA